MEDVAGALVAYSTAPHWYAELLGPIPEGEDERAFLQLNVMVFPDRESVELNVWDSAERMCKSVGWKFDPDQWELIKLMVVNGN